jgi:Na+-transporting methylmalonyl-CoA/oxaloacetate decarboxylase gamma subunit
MLPHLGLIVAQAAPAASPDIASGFEEGSMVDALVIAAVGLTIVFVALVLISLFIAMLPRVLTLIGHFWPEVEEHHAVEHVESETNEDLAVLAGIGFVLHTEFQRQLGGAAASKKPS